MKINKRLGVIQLGRQDTQIWNCLDGEGFAFRATVRAIAKSLSSESGGSAIEIYAAAEFGGWMADQIRAERS